MSIFNRRVRTAQHWYRQCMKDTIEQEKHDNIKFNSKQFYIKILKYYHSHYEKIMSIATRMNTF